MGPGEGGPSAQRAAHLQAVSFATPPALAAAAADDVQQLHWALESGVSADVPAVWCAGTARDGRGGAARIKEEAQLVAPCTASRPTRRPRGAARRDDRLGAELQQRNGFAPLHVAALSGRRARSLGIPLSCCPSPPAATLTRFQTRTLRFGLAGRAASARSEALAGPRGEC